MRVLPFILLFIACSVAAQKIDQRMFTKEWDAYWITVPGAPKHDYGVYNFRKAFRMEGAPSEFIIHVSADNRYKLFVNGRMVSHGPARGDLYAWPYETVDIAAYLQAGENVISAVVWNAGEQRPEAQISYRTGFILQGNTDRESVVNTNEGWKCRRDESYQPLPPDLIYTYYVCGPGDLVDFQKQETGWHTAAFNDNAWAGAQHISQGLPKGVFEWSLGWMLVPRTIPQMELRDQRFARVRKTENYSIPKGPAGTWPAVRQQLTIPASTTVTMLLDQDHLTNAYPVLRFGGGREARVTLSYAEALYIKENGDDWRAQHQKGNRNEIENKRFVGVSDQVISNGTSMQEFTPLWWRTFRYVLVKIETKGEPLVIHDLYSVFTGYPFKEVAMFDAKRADLRNILQVGWRTARLCAVETYIDCPYYEQLQYVGDTRIQALLSLYNSGDDRLMRNAIELLDNSRMPEGITQSRYPTANAQQIPTFALWWIGMIHDYYYYRPDHAFVKEKLMGTRNVLQFFSRYQQDDGSVKNAPYWEFTDWATGPGWDRGVAPVGSDGRSAAIDLQLALAYNAAAELEEALGLKELAAQYRSAYDQLRNAIRKRYYNSSTRLFADTGEKDTYSQHVNTLAILAKVVEGDEARSLMESILSNKQLVPATIYFKYYVHRALATVGLGDRYLDLLADWHSQLSAGLTTWAEISDHNNSRSDCHAWGSSPNIEFYRIVLGIDTGAPGFAAVRIQPHLGPLKEAHGKIPHPNGMIEVSYTLKKDRWLVNVTLPPNIPGVFSWKGKEYPLKPGVANTLTL